jgi:glutamine amidotransferase
MCRHFAYLGPEVPLEALLFAPPYSLVRQSYAPRRQRNGILNADGFGIGWYPGAGEPPARYRRSVPIWGDVNLADLAHAVSAGAVLAAVRSATPGLPVQEGANAPFTTGRWLFSHNGMLMDWPGCIADVAPDLPPAALARQGTVTDSTFMWAAILERVEHGEDIVEALRAVAAAARERTGGRVNLLLHDGGRIVATAAGDTLCYRQGVHPGTDGVSVPGVIVASEPFDDAEGWVDVPDGTLLLATAADVRLHPLTEPLPADFSTPEVP